MLHINSEVTKRDEDMAQHLQFLKKSRIWITAPTQGISTASVTPPSGDAMPLFSRGTHTHVHMYSLPHTFTHMCT